MSSIRVATDVGGTFTDLVYFETTDDGRQLVRTAKADTTPPDFENGVLNVINKADVAMSEVDFFVHGSTVVINALTERKGAKVGLITTKGFRDSLEIARGNRPDFFNLFYEKPEPFVPRYLRREIPGRATFLGEVAEPVDLTELPQIVADFKAEGVESVAICLLHSYALPDQEVEVLNALRTLWPDVPAVASHQITREWREYERTSTAVLSAYVQPVAERYLNKLNEGIKSQDFDGRFYVMQSNCGVDTVEKTRETPITMVESGPASGFWGAAALGTLIGEPNILALDIGGTTAKCSLIENGHVKVMTDYWIERDRKSAGYPIMTPVIDLVEIGNGGGSIAWVDDFGKMHVGPQSAGALPGPAAYGHGAGFATTTDANLILGRINAKYFRGGEAPADMDAARDAMKAVGDKIDADIVETARGVVRIANDNMVNALKLVSVNRGHDPRDFTLVAFGGGGGMHASALCAELGVKKMIVPQGAAVFSAWGMMMSDLRRDYFVTKLVDANPKDASAINALCQEIEAVALGQFTSDGVETSKVSFQRWAKLRYQNQEHSVEVLLPEGEISASAIETLIQDFHEAYEKEYTYRLTAPVEFVGLHLIAFAEVGKLEPAKLPVTGASVAEAVKEVREVDYALEGVHEAKIYDASKLEPGMKFEGPAIIEDSGTTIVVHPGDKVNIDDWGNIVVNIREV